MTNQESQEQNPYTTEDIKRYRPIALAQEQAKDEDNLKNGKLEQTLLKFNEEAGIKYERQEDAETAARTLVSNPRALQEYIANFGEKFGKALEGSTIGQLYELYSEKFDSYLSPESLAKAQEIFEANADRKYGEFMEDYIATGEIVKSKTDNFTKEQKEKAKEKLKYLNKIMVPLNAFENLELKALEGPIDKKTLGKQLNSLYEERPEQPQKEQEYDMAV